MARPRLECATTATYALLALACGAAFVMPRGLSVPGIQASADPDVVHILGTVRDFHRAHPDFNVVPAGGYGHFAGTVDLTAGPNDLPVLAAGGAGFRVIDEWLDEDSNPIPPHLALESSAAPPGSSAVPVVNPPTILGSGNADTFDSALGPYGGTNIGPAPTFVSGSAMPPVAPPTGMPARIALLRYSSGTTTLSGDRYVNDFDVTGTAILRISGDVRILADNSFSVQNSGRIELLPGATLTVWVRSACWFGESAQANVNTADPSRFMLYNLGTAMVRLEDNSRVYASVTSPGARLQIEDSPHFYGKFTGLTVRLQDSGRFHLDTSGGPPVPAMVCGTEVNDTFGSGGASGTGGVTSAATFDEWFVDVLGTNLSTSQRITLVDDGTGMYEYRNDAFFPIDGQLLGDEGDAHNFFFTYEFSAAFTFEACAGQFWEFEGADDAWLFVDGRLGLDVGGVMPDTVQRVSMDRLGLADGQRYTLRFFYAQRNGTSALFRIRTNLLLESRPLPLSVTAAGD